MLLLMLLGATLAVLAGIVVKVLVDRIRVHDDRRITGAELVVGSLICALVLVPAVTGLGYKIARADAVTFHEYWSGLEKSADVNATACTKDGSCRHTYDCDSYVVMVTKYRTETHTEPDGNGGTRTVTEQVAYQEPETRWHSCPYVTHEYTYTVSDTLGETHTLGSHWFPENPSQHRWTGSGYSDARWGFGAPGLPNVPSGQPAQWVEAKERLDAGTPGGVTAVHDYKNYILASQDDIYAKSSGAITGYRKAGLLPKPVTGTHDFYKADKVYFVGPTPGSAKDWQDSLLRFNGHFGSKRQGDLHLIVVTDPKVTNPDEYTNAVRAYWQSPDLGRDALSKNGYVVVVGSLDAKSVGWARGFSGMPVGNEAVDVAVRENLPEESLTPAALLGTPDHQGIDGVLGDLLLAATGGFERVEMKGFDYLFEMIQPSRGQQVLILSIALLLALGLWGLFVAVELPTPGRPRRHTDPQVTWLTPHLNRPARRWRTNQSAIGIRRQSAETREYLDRLRAAQRRHNR